MRRNRPHAEQDHSFPVLEDAEGAGCAESESPRAASASSRAFAARAPAMNGLVHGTRATGPSDATARTSRASIA